MDEGSRVQQVINLKPGEAFSWSRVVPRGGSVQTVRNQMTNVLSPIIARAKKQVDRGYHFHTLVGLTNQYDIVVTGIIVVEDDEI